MFGTLMVWGLILIVGCFIVGITLGILGWLLGEIADLFPIKKI